MTQDATSTASRVTAAVLVAAARQPVAVVVAAAAPQDDLQQQLVDLMWGLRRAACASYADGVEIALHGAARDLLTLPEAIDLGNRSLQGDPTARMELTQRGVVGSWQARQMHAAALAPTAA